MDLAAEPVTTAGAIAANCHAAYLEADPHHRRLMNQAFFKRVWVDETGVVGWEYNDPFAVLMTAHGQPVTTFPQAVTDAGITEQSTNQHTQGRVVSLHVYERRRPVRGPGRYVRRVRKRNSWRRRWDSNPR